MNRIISSIVILLTLVFLDGCVYYVDLWQGGKSFNYSGYFNAKACGRIIDYHLHYPYCPNQKCKEQWSAHLENGFKGYTLEQKNNRIQECLEQYDIAKQ